MLKIRKHKPWTPWIELTGTVEEIMSDETCNQDTKFLFMIMDMMRSIEPKACLSTDSIQYFLKHNEKALSSAFSMFNNAVFNGHCPEEIKKAILEGDRSFFERRKLKLIDQEA